MDEVTHEEVFSVYGRVLEAFARQGLRCEIIGGQALMQLGFTTWTKDLDLAVPPPALPQCLQVLEAINWRGQGFNYRPVGAPLADPWMAGGWSAHLEMPLGVPFSPRVDLLTQLPRLAADWHLRPFTLADSRRSASIGLDPSYLRFFPCDEQLLQSAVAMPTLPGSTSADSRGESSPVPEGS